MPDRNALRSERNYPTSSYMDIAKAFLARIEAAITAHGLSPRAFGEEAINDPSFVKRLRDNRNSPTVRTINRVDEFIAKLERKAKKGKAA